MTLKELTELVAGLRRGNYLVIKPGEAELGDCRRVCKMFRAEGRKYRVTPYQGGAMITRMMNEKGRSKDDSRRTLKNHKRQ